MIKNYKFKEFNVYEKDESGKYLAILNSFLDGKIEGKKLNSNKDRSVFLIEVDGKRYILKHDLEVDKRFEKRVVRFIRGAYFSKLIYRVNKALKSGCSVTNDIYLVLERVKFRQAKETYILSEFIDGTVLDRFDFKEYKDEIKSAINELHRFDLASNDIHSANMIIAQNGKIKIIDLSDYGSLSKCKANDALKAKTHFDVDIGLRSFTYFFIKFKNRLRDIKHDIQGREF